VSVTVEVSPLLAIFSSEIQYGPSQEAGWAAESLWTLWRREVCVVQ
jgi:hypothetical protein